MSLPIGAPGGMVKGRLLRTELPIGRPSKLTRRTPILSSLTAVLGSGQPLPRIHERRSAAAAAGAARTGRAFSIAALLAATVLRVAPAHGQSAYPVPAEADAPAHGQYAAPIRAEIAAPARSAAQRPLLLLAGAGLIGGAAGWYGGAHLGSVHAQDCTTPPCGIAGVSAAVIGESLGIALGVHLANGRKGELVSGINGALFSGLISALVLSRVGGQDASDAVAAVTLGAVPLIQVGATILIERRTAPAPRDRPPR